MTGSVYSPPPSLIPLCLLPTTPSSDSPPHASLPWYLALKPIMHWKFDELWVKTIFSLLNQECWVFCPRNGKVTKTLVDWMTKKMTKKSKLVMWKFSNLYVWSTGIKGGQISIIYPSIYLNLYILNKSASNILYLIFVIFKISIKSSKWYMICLKNKIRVILKMFNIHLFLASMQQSNWIKLSKSSSRYTDIFILYPYSYGI